MIHLTADEYFELSEMYFGICIECKHRQAECEPDARNYVCEECGKSKVFGVEELMMMGEIELST